jgi:hypothetical protein
MAYSKAKLKSNGAKASDVFIPIQTGNLVKLVPFYQGAARRVLRLRMEEKAPDTDDSFEYIE